MVNFPAVRAQLNCALDFKLCASPIPIEPESGKRESRVRVSQRRIDFERLQRRSLRALGKASRGATSLVIGSLRYAFGHPCIRESICQDVMSMACWKNTMLLRMPGRVNLLM